MNETLKNAPQKNGAPGEPPQFEVKEKKLLGELQCSRDRLRELRQYFLTEGVHWGYVQNHVFLSSDGAAILRQNRSAVIPPQKNGAPVAANAAPKTPKLLTFPTPFDGRLIAWKSPVVNTTILIAYRPGTDPTNPLNLVTVRVRDNRNFVRNDPLTCRQVNENLFDLVGPCPSYRGQFQRKKQLN